MTDPITVNFNTPGTTDTILHSPDGLLWADRIELDVATRTVAFFNGVTFLGTIKYTGPVDPKGKIIVSFDAGFRVSAG